MTFAGPVWTWQAGPDPLGKQRPGVPGCGLIAAMRNRSLSRCGLITQVGLKRKGFQAPCSSDSLGLDGASTSPGPGRSWLRAHHQEACKSGRSDL